jgi:hypothetical protein
MGVHYTILYWLLGVLDGPGWNGTCFGMDNGGSQGQKLGWMDILYTYWWRSLGKACHRTAPRRLGLMYGNWAKSTAGFGVWII